MEKRKVKNFAILVPRPQVLQAADYLQKTNQWGRLLTRRNQGRKGTEKQSQRKSWTQPHFVTPGKIIWGTEGQRWKIRDSRTSVPPSRKGKLFSFGKDWRKEEARKQEKKKGKERIHQEQPWYLGSSSSQTSRIASAASIRTHHHEQNKV